MKIYVKLPNEDKLTLAGDDKVPLYVDWGGAVGNVITIGPRVLSDAAECNSDEDSYVQTMVKARDVLVKDTHKVTIDGVEVK